jgi:hypothetical protein
MQGFIAGAGQTCIAFWNLGEGISLMEVGVIVITWQPTGGLLRSFGASML